MSSEKPESHLNNDEPRINEANTSVSSIEDPPMEEIESKSDDENASMVVEEEENEEAEDNTEKSKADVRETVILAGFILTRTLWQEENEKAKWIRMQGEHIEEVTTSILAMMDREVPTNFLIMMYQEFVHKVDIATLESHIDQVTAKARNSEIHKVTVPTLWNRPEDERIWGSISAINQHIRIVTLDMGRPVLSMHKAMLISNNNGKIQYIRPEMWSEYQNRIGLGATLSFEALKMVKSYIKKYLDGKGFDNIDRPRSNTVAPDMLPPPLCYTRGYKDDDKMMEFIKEAGLRTPAKPTSFNRPGAPGKGAGSSGTQRAPRSSKPSAARRLDISSDEDDYTEGERRTRRYLEAKKKIGKKRGEDTDDLANQLKNMRVEGIRASKRSKEKYEKFEDKIKDLEGKMSEKDRKLKKLYEKEKRITMLEDKLDDKYKVIKKLRADLAEADCQIEEWREAYEQEKKAADDERDAYDELEEQFKGLKRKRRQRDREDRESS